MCMFISTLSSESPFTVRYVIRPKSCTILKDLIHENNYSENNVNIYLTIFIFKKSQSYSLFDSDVIPFSIKIYCHCIK